MSRVIIGELFLDLDSVKGIFNFRIFIEDLVTKTIRRPTKNLIKEKLYTGRQKLKNSDRMLSILYGLSNTYKILQELSLKFEDVKQCLTLYFSVKILSRGTIKNPPNKFKDKIMFVNIHITENA